MPVSARKAAQIALSAYRTRQARPELVLSNTAKAENMPARETALALRIVSGVLENEAFLDYYIELYSNRKKSYFDSETLDVLRMSAYQLWFLDRVPAHAAVSEAVDLAPKRAKALVNAILRKLPEKPEALPEIKAESENERLSIKYSHPVWLVQRLNDEYGADVCEEILRADNLPARVSLILNTLRAEKLEEEGIEPSGLLDNACFLSGGGVEELEAFKRGEVYVQDVSAYLAVCAAGPKPGDTVLDTCAAPGGKSFAAAIMMRDKGRIISRDIHEKKLRLIETGAERLGIGIIETEAADAREAGPELLGKCDVVLTDVPCSGIGVIRKKPEIRYKRPEEIRRLPEIQLSILRAGAENVKKGGVLLYSTCTILKEENEKVVSDFLNENRDFELEPFSLPGPFGKSGGMRTILPFEYGTDGFFICRMRRKMS